MIAASVARARGQGLETPADSVTTRESTVVIQGAASRRIQFEAHDYFVRPLHPGSALTEVLCFVPKTSATQSDHQLDANTLSVASRSRDFVDRLAAGCAAKDGVMPASFTFEQINAREKNTGHEASKLQKKVELLGPNSFPPDVDPHILPAQLPAGGDFNWNEKRY